MVATRNRQATKPLNGRQNLFATLIVAGKTQAEAYRRAYGKPKAKERHALEAGCRIAAHPAVIARVAELRARADAGAILSLNQRLALLGTEAMKPCKTASDRNARARLIEVYNKTAGDHAPERQEVVVKGDAGSPVVVTSRPMTKAEKVAALIAQRRAAAEAPPSPA